MKRFLNRLLALMPTTIEAAHILGLMAILSPAFPTGSFAYSHGLEWAIDQRVVSDASDVEAWISSLLTHGSSWNDAVLFARAYDADDGEIQGLDELALALSASREREFETLELGQSFNKAFAALTKSEACGAVCYPVVVACACRQMGIPKKAALLGYMQAFSNGLIAVALRLVPLGQNAGLEIMGSLMPVILATAERALVATLDDLGSSSFLSDIASMKHETQYSRVFRT